MREERKRERGGIIIEMEGKLRRGMIRRLLNAMIDYKKRESEERENQEWKEKMEMIVDMKRERIKEGWIEI